MKTIVQLIQELEGGGRKIERGGEEDRDIAGGSSAEMAWIYDGYAS